MAGLTKNANMLPTLKNGLYNEKALMPTTSWLKTAPTSKPELNVSVLDHEVVARWNSSKMDNVFQWVLYAQYGTEWEYLILNKSQLSQGFPQNKNGKVLTTLAIKAVDRLGNESDYQAKKVK